MTVFRLENIKIDKKGHNLLLQSEISGPSQTVKFTLFCVYMHVQMRMHIFPGALSDEIWWPISPPFPPLNTHSELVFI